MIPNTHLIYCALYIVWIWVMIVMSSRTKTEMNIFHRDIFALNKCLHFIAFSLEIKSIHILFNLIILQATATNSKLKIKRNGRRSLCKYISKMHLFI